MLQKSVMWKGFAIRSQVICAWCAMCTTWDCDGCGDVRDGSCESPSSSLSLSVVVSCAPSQPSQTSRLEYNVSSVSEDAAVRQRKERTSLLSIRLPELRLLYGQPAFSRSCSALHSATDSLSSCSAATASQCSSVSTASSADCKF